MREQVRYITCDICKRKKDEPNNYPSDEDYIQTISIPIFCMDDQNKLQVVSEEKEVCRKCLLKLTNVRYKQNSLDLEIINTRIKAFDHVNERKDC